ncbi:AAA family ATPase [Mycobacterium sp. WMMD1722]|uniref:AAA family ATPase n=1 Tax=Mycobacterium sp. WMMD1722 TaxID=3404117 RepID=UPI003BF5D9F5
MRKTVTVLFADLAGSTAFEERVDAETAREVIGRYHTLLRTTSDRHRAGVVKYIGDGFMALWGVPDVGPDDAVRAVEGAVALQDEFVGLAAHVQATYGAELALRVAVNTGEVVVGLGDADLVGDALNVAARLESLCPHGGVVVGEETWRSTRDSHRYESAGRVQVKGRSAPVAVYHWRGRRSDTPAPVALVGRTTELTRLQAALDSARTNRTARLVTVVGEPGVGKSRLAAEFAAGLPQSTVLQARCDLDGTVALAPLVEMLRAVDLRTSVPSGVPERERLLRDLDGLMMGVPGSVEETFWALRRFVEVLGHTDPVVLILDDIQWAAALLLDFIEHLVEWVHDAPLLVLALARPELREVRPDLVTASRWVFEAIHLDGLDGAATARLAATVLGTQRLPAELVERLSSSTGGNPLFVRELIGMLAHDGVLVEQSAGWRLTIDVDAITIPPTIHALLASRLERLAPADRRVLEVASVSGYDFSIDSVVALTAADPAAIAESLNRLRRLDLAQPSGAYLGDEPVWRFHHVLIRDVAYRRLLKSDRAELHERLADWVRAGRHAAFDTDEVIARHLEAAHGYRVDLGAPTQHVGELAVRAARHYAVSARRALDRDELISAGTQAVRGAALAPAEDPVRNELLLIGCEAFLSAGDVASGAPLVDEFAGTAESDLRPWATCYRAQLSVYTDPERLLEVDADLTSAIEEFTARQDAAGLAKAYRVRAGARSRLGRIGDCEADLFEALIAARRSGDHRQIAAALGAAPSAALWGPSPVPKAGGRCLDVVRMQRMTTAAPSLEATSLRCLAVLELLRGRPAKARSMLAEARQVVADLGLRHGLMETELFAGIIEASQGDFVAAEPHFRTALEGLDALGVGVDAGQAAALLARAVLEQGRVDEADRYARESERLAGRNLKTAIAWRAVRAEILAAQGRHDDAVATARDAVAVAAGTDLVLDHAEACLALTRVLTAAGDSDGARRALDEATSLYAAKEVAAAARATAASGGAPPDTEHTAPGTRLAVVNRVSRLADSAWQAMASRDVAAAVSVHSDRFTYDDRRRVSGEPIDDVAELSAASERILDQYPHSDWRTLAVRGEYLELRWSRLWDDAGNEAATLNVLQAGPDGRINYFGRFDDDDLDNATRELDRRYYAGEGARFAENGLPASEAPRLLDSGRLDTLFSELTAPDLQVESRSARGFPVRSAGDLRESLGQLDDMVTARRTWMSTVRWLSPTWSVVRLEREATGSDGERYAWTMILVSQHRSGRIVSICEFDADDEDAAFAYAEERARTAHRLTLANRATDTMAAMVTALGRRDVEATLALLSERFTFADHRALGGAPIHDMRPATLRVVEQFNHFDWRPLAVRGDRLLLAWSQWSDDAGNRTCHLHVQEVEDDGLITHEGRFDADDFETAYTELERRYYAGEGAAFAASGVVSTAAISAINRNDYDRLMTEVASADLRVENRSRSLFPDRSADELRASFGQLNAMVSSARTWLAAVIWMSPHWNVTRLEREAVGPDGERFTWERILVTEIRDDRLTLMCEFELEDEDAAFAYVEERARPSAHRLAVSNRCTQMVADVLAAFDANDIDGAFARISESYVYNDRRRLAGTVIDDIATLRTATDRIRKQYSHFHYRPLAVRGDTVCLYRSRWLDDSGNETGFLHVFEIGHDGLSRYEGRFDTDDFEAAYSELEQRYYAGEGAAHADIGAAATGWVTAVNRGDFDRAFDGDTYPVAPAENRSRAVFPDPAVSGLAASLASLTAMVSSACTWASALRWIGRFAVARLEREATGPDGESYSWTWLVVCETLAGRFVATHMFDLADEDAAFALAEQGHRTDATRLAKTNRCCETVEALQRAMNDADLDAAVACYAHPSVYDDHRRLRGAPVRDAAGLRAAGERILRQYTSFRFQVVAVRGDRLSLHRSAWSDEAGNESVYLHVYEVGPDGRFLFEGRFDADDFVAAYRELSDRYHAGEGAAFAEWGAVEVGYAASYNTGDFERMFGELTHPDISFGNRSRSGFPDRSRTALRASVEEMAAMVSTSRIWNSVVWWVAPGVLLSRMEREAVGRDGEHYLWERILVTEIAGGQVVGVCEFDPEDEAAAFAHAQERVRAPKTR